MNKSVVLRLSTGAAAFAVGVGLTGCAYTESSALDIDAQSVTCFMDSHADAAVLQIPIRAERDLQFDPQVLGVKLGNPEGVILEGVGILPDGVDSDPSEHLPEELVESMRASGGERLWDSEPVTRDDPSTLVVLIGLDKGRVDGAIGSVRVIWGGGEPIYWQPLDVSVTISESCEVALSASH